MKKFPIIFISIKSIQLITGKIATTMETSGKNTVCHTCCHCHGVTLESTFLFEFVNQQVCWHSRPRIFEFIPPSKYSKVSAPHAELASTLNQ